MLLHHTSTVATTTYIAYEPKSATTTTYIAYEPKSQQQMQVAPIPNPPRPTPIPAQPIPNPNNRPTQPVQNIEVQTFPTYVITPASFNGIQLRSGRVLNKPNPTVVIQEEEQVDNQVVEEEEQMDNQSDEERDTPVQQEIPPHTSHPSKYLRKLILPLIQKGYL
jgi:hypothetical protein